jgi:hypothetical protein
MSDDFQKTFNKHKMFALKKTNNIDEIFTIEKKSEFKKDLKMFLQSEFEKHNLGSNRMGLSVTDYKPEDWIETMADTIINNFAGYLEKIRGQTERDLTPKNPIVNDKI